MPRIVGVGRALPTRSYRQEEITSLLAPMLTDDPVKQAVVSRIHANTGVRTRHLVRPLEEYLDETSFTQSNELFIAAATELARVALVEALDRAGIAAGDVDFILFTSVTGVSAPSIDALLVPLVGMRSDVKRVPMFGLGCVAGAAGIARLDDYLAGHPNDVGVLVAVELCSLTVQRDDESMANVVASGLFGDGAGSVVMVGDAVSTPGARDQIAVQGASSRLYPNTGDILGFNPGETGFRITLTAGVADVVDASVGTDTVEFLGAHGLRKEAIDVWIAHPGGPKVLDAFSAALDLPEAALHASWSSLARVGNLSSASVLHILADDIEAGRLGPGKRGLLFALGPGVCAEFVLLAGLPESEG